MDQHSNHEDTAFICRSGLPGQSAAGASEQAELRNLLEATVAVGFDINEHDLRQPTRGEARTALARQAAMYLAHVALGMTKAEAGRLFDRDRTTVHHACAVIEQRRDDDAFNHALDHLERIIRIVAGPVPREAA